MKNPGVQNSDHIIVCKVCSVQQTCWFVTILTAMVTRPRKFRVKYCSRIVQCPACSVSLV